MYAYGTPKKSENPKSYLFLCTFHQSSNIWMSLLSQNTVNFHFSGSKHNASTFQYLPAFSMPGQYKEQKLYAYVN